jgi:hypothetical protein
MALMHRDRLFGFEKRGLSVLKVAGIVLVFVGALCVQAVSHHQASRVWPAVIQASKISVSMPVRSMKGPAREVEV